MILQICAFVNSKVFRHVPQVLPPVKFNNNYILKGSI